jgi:hypothetical protein
MDQLPKILIDTATRSGMSGSPVLVIHRGLHRERSAPDRWSVGTAKAFAGVYSSRVGDSTGLQLGTVWKASVIDEIIDGEIIGRGPHDHST